MLILDTNQTNSVSYESWHLHQKFETSGRSLKFIVWPQEVSEVTKVKIKKILGENSIIVSFYPDFILILFRFLETHFIQILSWFYPDFIQIKSVSFSQLPAVKKDTHAAISRPIAIAIKRNASLCCKFI